MKIAPIGLVLSLAFAVSAAEPASATYKSTLSKVSPPELPAQAALLVKRATTDERSAVTVGVVQAAVTLNPNSASAVVGAVARAVPEVAAAAAATAASAQPGQVAEITRAAAKAAPAELENIVTAVCRAVPTKYKSVALAAAKAVPGSQKKIVMAVAAAIPDLKPGIEQALAVAGRNVSVAAVLDSAQGSVAAAGQGDGAVRGPAVGPPYIPLSGTPVNLSPASSTAVPPGGRQDYTAP